MGAHVEKKLKALDVKRMTKPGRYADGGGLYLTVTKSGSKSWTLRNCCCISDLDCSSSQMQRANRLFA